MGHAALRAWVLSGARVSPARYESSAAQPAVALSHNALGDLTFESPSGNISCDLRPAAAGEPAMTLCWAQVAGRPKARPATCKLEWVPGIVSMTAGKTTVGSCLGGVPFGRFANTLAYGSTLVHGGLACRSDSRYVACVALDGAGAFLVNRNGITVVG